ncbi:MAG: hypothetical protein WBN70_10070 [Polyangiales bacterium]
MRNLQAVAAGVETAAVVVVGALYFSRPKEPTAIPNATLGVYTWAQRSA